MQRESDVEPGDNILLSKKHLKLEDKPGKLRPWYVGPFKVLRMIGRNAAKFKLPPVIKVRPILNVALLKRYHS